MTIYSDALGKQSTFNTNLIAKLQELATAVGNRVRSADLYDGNGKIKSNLLPFAINDLLEMKGALTLQSYPYQITSGSGTKDGEIYIVTEAATGLAIDDITEVKVGDWVLAPKTAKSTSSLKLPPAWLLTTSPKSKSATGFCSSTANGFVCRSATRL
jgi:hypothetical protein